MVSLLPIVPQSNLFLTPYGCRGERRFAKLFKETWERLPASVRRTMLKHWRNANDVDRIQAALLRSRRNGDAKQFKRVVPVIQLLPCWVEEALVLEKDGLEVYADVLPNGCFMRFHEPRIASMPKEAVIYVIAHELAHVYQAATGGWRSSESKNEAEANGLAAQWGFSEAPLIAWEKLPPRQRRPGKRHHCGVRLGTDGSRRSGRSDPNGKRLLLNPMHFLDQQEISALITAASAKGKAGLRTDSDKERWISWAADVECQHRMLTAAIQGHLLPIGIGPGDKPRFLMQSKPTRSEKRSSKPSRKPADRRRRARNAPARTTRGS